MIVNRKVIQDEILRQTLHEQVSRLSYLCTNRNFNHLQQKIHSLENEISYAAYNYNQKLSNLQSQKAHSAKVYSEAIHEKKLKDIEKKQRIQYNRSLLSNLQKTRRQLADQNKKNNEAEVKSIDLAKQEKSLSQKFSSCEKRTEQQQIWIKRLQAAEQLCKREVATQKETIQSIKMEIKIEQIGNSSIRQGIQEVKRQIDNARLIKQQNYAIIEKEKLLFQMQEKDCQKQSEHLNQEREQKMSVVSEYECKHNDQDQQNMLLKRKVKQNKQRCHDLEDKVVKNMRLIEEVNNQLFETRLNKTNSKIKTKELVEKIERLKRVKAELFDLIC